MQKKNIVLSACVLWLFSVIYGYGLVFAGGSNIQKVFMLSNNIFIDTIKSNQTFVMFESKSNLSTQKITADCDFYSKLPEKRDDYYLYQIKFFNESCRGKVFTLASENTEEKYYFSLKFYSKYSLLTDFLDRSDSDIISTKKKIQKSLSKILEAKSYTGEIKQKRKIWELEYILTVVQEILDARSLKYSIPVAGQKLSQDPNTIPNAGRPYRASYTDGIHHGWDIDGKLWESVIALDDGIIIRSVHNFEANDFNKIVYGKNLSYEQKLWNLDILRGNQVWLKTMKWDVVFYSHLNNVFSNIIEGTIVRKGQAIGTIWKTGVPGENYDDYHLHFPIHKNPYNKKAKQEYSFEDYMKWSWIFQWKSGAYILENQKNIFE